MKQTLNVQPTYAPRSRGYGVAGAHLSRRSLGEGGTSNSEGVGALVIAKGGSSSPLLDVKTMSAKPSRLLSVQAALAFHGAAVPP